MYLSNIEKLFKISSNQIKFINLKLEKLISYVVYRFYVTTNTHNYDDLKRYNT